MKSYQKRNPQNSGDWTYRRGDIYMANLNPFKGSEQGGTRPVLDLPTHTYFERVKGLREPSMVSLEQIKTIDKCRVIAYLGRLTRAQMMEVDEACLTSLGMTVPECVEAP